MKNTHTEKKPFNITTIKHVTVLRCIIEYNVCCNIFLVYNVNCEADAKGDAKADKKLATRQTGEKSPTHREGFDSGFDPYAYGYGHSGKHSGSGYSAGSGLRSIAQGSADQAHSIVSNQHLAANQAAYVGE